VITFAPWLSVGAFLFVCIIIALLILKPEQVSHSHTLAAADLLNCQGTVAYGVSNYGSRYTNNVSDTAKGDVFALGGMVVEGAWGALHADTSRLASQSITSDNFQRVHWLVKR
jgi:hypothetical protein